MDNTARTWARYGSGSASSVELTKVSDGEEPAEEGGVREVPVAGNLATRLACVAMHLVDGLGEQALAMHRKARYTAWAPSAALDLQAVLRHARQAYRRHIMRDIVVCSAVLVAVAVVGVRALGSHGPVLTLIALVAVPALLAVFPVRRWYARRWPERYARAKANARSRIGGDPGGQLVLIVVGLAVLGGLSWILVGNLVSLVVTVAALAVALVATLTDAVVSHERAARVKFGARRFADLAPPLPADLEERVRQVQTPASGEDIPRICVYSARTRAGQPFVGSGESVGESDPIIIDTAKGKGKKKPRGSVDVVDLHRRLEEKAPACMRDLVYGHRMYVDGQEAPNVAGVMPDRDGPPDHTTSKAALFERIHQIESHCRTYFVMQAALPGGLRLVTLFVRAQLHDIGRLEIRTDVAPLDMYPWPAYNELPKRWWHRATHAIGAGLRSYGRVMAGSPVRCAQAVIRPARRSWAARKLRWRIRDRGMAVDFGAPWSLRECLGWDPTFVREKLQRDDAASAATQMMEHVKDVLKEYLDELGIDTSSLREEFSVVIKQQQIDIRNFEGVGLFGDGNKVRYDAPKKRSKNGSKKEDKDGSKATKDQN
jgi:hypothetical protein